ncbi:MAG: bacterial Ig-like domain-containing protein [Clostridia bacterium]|nr:bacterial Ig-like domain-containing protein [Clostridia bacterium]
MRNRLFVQILCGLLLCLLPFSALGEDLQNGDGAEQPAFSSISDESIQEASDQGTQEPIVEEAAETSSEVPESDSVIELAPIDLVQEASNEDLFYAYVNAMFRSGRTTNLTFPRMKSLPDPSQVLAPTDFALEQALKEQMVRIASGVQTSTKVSIRLADIGISSWSQIENYEAVIRTLIRDCSYEMYWFGRRIQNGSISKGVVTLPFLVASDFAKSGASYEVDPAQVLAAKAAVENAKQIVSEYASLPDYEKLLAYRDKICSLVSYHYDAARNSSSYGENPWQLIYVFDNDPETNVVCEGYAKAFEYLCNQSVFRSPLINCFCASGSVRFSAGGGGGHMWNILTMDDGRNYMIDLTNSDLGATGSNIRFLAPAASGSVDDGYTFETGDWFPYDTATRLACSDDSLTLSDTPYLISIQMQTYPDKVTYHRGQAFDPAGGKLLLTYHNGTPQAINLPDERVSLSGYDKMQCGEQTIRVAYDHCTTTFRITVTDDVPASIAVTTLPDRTIYLEAKDAFDPAGGEITLTYADGETGTIDLAEAAITGFDNTAVGEQILTVSYGGQAATFPITIRAKTLLTLSITALPDRLEYFEGDAFDPAGGQLFLEYDNDTTETIGFADASVSGYDSGVIGEQLLTVSYRGKGETFTVTVLRKNRIVFEEGALPQTGTVEVDGIPYPVTDNQVLLPYGLDASIMTEYTYNTVSENPHEVYPTGMRVWRVDPFEDIKIASPLPELTNLLQYSGSSIRFSGNKGIRMITSIPKEERTSLIQKDLAGFTLVEYGTVVAWDSELAGSPLLLNGVGAKQAYAYRKGVADPIFKDTGKLIQYTNVLVGLTDEKCVPDLAMRPYMILQFGEETTVLYGGTIHRSIGYIAYQNRNAFQPKTSAYQFLWDIIHYVYGDSFDSDYRG